MTLTSPRLSTLLTAAHALGVDPRGGFVEIRNAGNYVCSTSEGEVYLKATRVVDAPQRKHIYEHNARVIALADTADVLAPLTPAPVVVHGWAVTAWQRGTVADPRSLTSFADMGAAARTLADPATQRLCRDARFATLPRQSLVKKITDRCDTQMPAAGVPRHIIDGFREHAEALREVFDDTMEHAPLAMIHADLHPDNMVYDDKGRATLIDLDSLCLGVDFYDAVPTAAGERAGIFPVGALESFIAGYGRDPRTLDVFESFVQLRLLTMSSFIATGWARGQVWQEETLKRWQAIDSGTYTRPWVVL